MKECNMLRKTAEEREMQCVKDGVWNGVEKIKISNRQGRAL